MIDLPDCILESDTLRLRRATPADAEGMARYHQDEAPGLQPWDVSWNPRRLEAQWHAAEVVGPDRWVGVLLPAHANGPVQGLIELHWRGSWAHLAYSLAAHARGQGLMGRALHAMLNCADGAQAAMRHEPASAQQPATAIAPRIVALIREDNATSARLVARLGFRDEGPDPAFPAVPVEGRWRRHHRWVRALQAAPR